MGNNNDGEPLYLRVGDCETSPAYVSHHHSRVSNFHRLIDKLTLITLVLPTLTHHGMVALQL